MSIFILLFLIIYIAPIYAVKPEKRSLEEVHQDQLLDKAPEKDIINGLISSHDERLGFSSLNRKSMEGVKDFNSLKIGNPYKQYLASGDLYGNLYRGNSILEIITNLKYKWVVPVYRNDREGAVDTYDFSFDTKMNKWKSSSTGSKLSPEQVSLCADVDRRIKLFKKYGIDKANYTAIIDCSILYHTWIYVLVDDQEYFIPLIYGIVNNYGLEDMKLYTREEFVKIMAPTFDIILGGNNSSSREMLEYGGVGAGQPTEEQQPVEDNNTEAAPLSNDVQPPPQAEAATQAANTEAVQQPAQSSSTDAEKVVASAADLQKQTDALADAEAVKSAVVRSSKQDSGNTAVKVLMWVLPIVLLITAGSFVLWKYKFSAKGKAG